MKEFDPYEIYHLPTLRTIVNHYKEEIQEFVENGGWQNNPTIGAFSPDMSWRVPGMEFNNLADNDKFIVGQTMKGRHILKPNLVNQCFLFRGEKKNHRRIISSFNREEIDQGTKENREKHLISNLKAEDFAALLRRHPLFMMLDRGIFLYPCKEPIFINMNYYGLAQHYNFRTGLLDFTSDIDVAAFFACTHNMGGDKYEPIIDLEKNTYGVLYVLKINPDVTFKYTGFTTIGLQLYPRTGAQKGFAFCENMIADVNNLVEPIYFKHAVEDSEYFYNLMDKGEKLFPSDSISKYAKEIIEGDEVSGETFAQNLYSNHDEYEANLDALHRHGIRTNWHKRMLFTDSMLNDLAQDLRNGLWENFCNQIYFPDKVIGNSLHDSLLHLPQNLYYKHFFDMKEYDRIMAYDKYLNESASKRGHRDRYC